MRKADTTDETLALCAKLRLVLKVLAVGFGIVFLAAAGFYLQYLWIRWAANA